MAGYDNNKLGELRPNQIITTFGPGAIVDAVKDSVTVLDINYWKEKGKKIIDGRLEEAIKAQKGGADYLGVGAVCATSTKKDANVVSKEEIKKICHTVEIPVVAIGGIKKENIKTLEGTDVDGVAVVSAIFAAKDIKKDTKQLRSLVEEMKQK